MSKSFLIEAQHEAGVKRALEYISLELGLSAEHNPDVSVLSFAVLTAEDARTVVAHASQGGLSGQRALVVACERIFHEAQNALLKLFEEPPEGFTLFLVVPSRSILLPTMLSRLAVLDAPAPGLEAGELAEHFLKAGKAEREKMIAKLLTQTKSDSDEIKQQARTDAVVLVGGIIMFVHKEWERTKSAELRTLLGELVELHPLLRGRSAPYKLIFEHLLVTVPKF